MARPGSHTAAISVEPPGLPDSSANDVDFLVAQSLREDRSEAVSAVAARTAGLLERTGRGLYLCQGDLSDLDLSGFDLRYSNLNRASLFGAKLVAADLSGCSMVCAGLERTDLTDACLRGAYVHALAVQASFLPGADLRELVDATGSLFHGCVLAGAKLAGSELAGATFYQCDLKRADLSEADLHGAVFNECGMARARLSGAHLAHVCMTRSSLTGVDLSNARGRWLSVQRPTSADRLVLQGANLPSLRLIEVRASDVSAAALHAPGIDVEGGDLAGIDLSGADLRHGRLTGVSLNEANLEGAVLQDTTLWGVTARRAKGAGVRAEGLTATECSFADAMLPRFAGRYATFRNCDLSGADLRGSYLYRASVIGDPPSSAGMLGVRLDGANLTQAYVAADLSDAVFPQGWATYARINQSVLEGADLRGTSLYRASAVKANFTGAQLGGQRGGLLADRCAGLVEALRASKDPGAADIADEVEAFAALLASEPGKST